MRPRSRISLLHLESSGWSEVESRRERRTWVLNNGDVVGVASYEGPGISVDLGDSSIPRHLREAALELAVGMNAGVVEIGVVEIDGRPCFRMITRQPQENQGLMYTGWINVSFPKFGYWVTVRCVEHGVTGIRDAAILVRLLASGDVTLDESTEQLDGLFLEDPVLPAAELRKHRAEDPAYDSEFPDHPLSRVRSCLSDIARTARLDRSLRLQSVPEPP